MQQYSDITFTKKYPLSHKKLMKKMLVGVIAYVVVCILLVTVLLRNNPTEMLILVPIILAFSLLLVAHYLYQQQYIKKYFYNMTDTFLIIRKGIFAPQEITVPIKRIQDVYVDQDIFDKLLGIYDVHISTATETSTERAHIDGVDKKVAEELREYILNKLQQTS